MILKPYTWGIKISMVISFVALTLVVKQIDPQKAGAAGQVLFFVSLWLFLSSVFILFFTWMRHVAGGSREDMLAQMGAGFRQGVLMGILLCLLLFLQQHRILTWWDGALAVVGILLAELYFLTRR